MNSENNINRFESVTKAIATAIAEFIPLSGMTLFVIFTLCFSLFLYGQDNIRVVVDELAGPYSDAISMAMANGLLITMVYYVIVKIAHIYGRPILGSMNGGSRENQGAVVSMAYAQAPKPLSPERIKRVARHEAGHLLAVALFRKKPKKLTAFVRAHQAPILGNVGYEFDDDEMCSKQAQESSMKVTLAGAVAEEMSFGDCMVGSQSDSEQWERQARNYLSAFSHSYDWFEVVGSDAEARLNMKTLRQIKKEQIAQVKQFIQGNAELLDEVSCILEEQRNMEGNDLIAIINRVKLH